MKNSDRHGRLASAACRPPPVPLPARKKPSSVGKGMNGLEAIMEDGGAEHGREFARLAVPPLQKLEHQSGDLGRGGLHIVANPHGDGSISSGLALVHHPAGQDTMQCIDLVMANRLLARLLLHIAQSCEIVEHLAPRALIGGGQLPSLCQGANLLQGKRFTFDGRGGVDVAVAGVLLPGRHRLHQGRASGR